MMLCETELEPVLLDEIESVFTKSVDVIFLNSDHQFILRIGKEHLVSLIVRKFVRGKHWETVAELDKSGTVAI